MRPSSLGCHRSPVTGGHPSASGVRSAAYPDRRRSDQSHRNRTSTGAPGGGRAHTSAEALLVFQISGDVVIQSVALILVALIGAVGAWAAAERGRRTQAEMKPNGGTSLRDAIDRLDARTTEHDRRFGRIESGLDDVASGLGEVASTLARMERRQTDITGETPVVEARNERSA